MRWGCYTASRFGQKQTDAWGNEIGCDVGKQIRDDLAVELLTKVFKSIPADFEWIIQNLTGIVVSAIASEADLLDNPDRLRKQIDQQQKKKEAAIDAFASGLITKEELRQAKVQYDAKIAMMKKKLCACQRAQIPTSSQRQSEISRSIRSIVSCEEFSEPFYKAVLQTMVVHKDGTLEIKINHLPQTWVYCLIYHRANPE